MAWIQGSAAPSWTPLFNQADLASLANGSSVMSSVADITNATSLDMFMDISFSLLIASSTIGANAAINFYMYMLNQDGTTYGDGQFVGGVQKAATPTFPSFLSFPLLPAAAQTVLVGNNFGNPIPITPGSYRCVMQDASGFALTAGTQTVKFRTYKY
jgi:hypothetical protein